MVTIAWIGGMFTNFFIYLPAMGKVLDPASTGKLMGAVMKRFRVMVYLSLSLLLLTGIFLGLDHSLPEGTLMAESDWNILFTIKIILYALMALLAIQAFEIIAPRAAAIAAKGPSPELQRIQKLQKGLAATGFLIGLLVIALSVLL